MVSRNPQPDATGTGGSYPKKVGVELKEFTIEGLTWALDKYAPSARSAFSSTEKNKYLHALKTEVNTFQ